MYSVSLRLIEDAVHLGRHITNSPADVALAASAYVAKNPHLNTLTIATSMRGRKPQNHNLF
jgi:hypothetical protein